MSGITFPTDTSTQQTAQYNSSGTFDPFIKSTTLSTQLALKQDTLTASTNLLGVGSAISALDYNKITLNKPSVFPPDTTNIYIKSETNNLLNNKQDNLTASTNLLGVGSAISALDYNKITLNKPDLTVYNAWTKNVNDIYTTNTAGNVGIGTNITTTYKLTVNGSLNATSLYIGGTLINFSSYQPIINTYTITGATGGSLSYSANTLTLAMPTTYTSLSIASLTSATSIFYKGFEISATYATIANLNLKENALTFSAPLTRTTNTIGIDLSTYQPLLTFSSPLSKTANTVSIDLSTYQPLLTFSSPLSKSVANAVSIDLSSYSTTTQILALSTLTNYYTKTSTDTLLNAKSPNLTFSSPLLNTTNNITIDLSSYLTTTSANNTYFQKTGGIISGKISIIRSTVDIPSLTTYGGFGDRIILYTGDATTYPYSIGIKSNSLWNSIPTLGNFDWYINGVNIMKLNSSGNLGIGTDNPTAKLHIEHSSTATNPSTSGLYVFNPNNTANHSSVIGCRIGGSSANKAIYSLDVSGSYGWSMYINGTDTNKLLRFNAGWDTLGTDRFSIAYNGQLTRACDIWHKSYDGIEREYYQTNTATYYKSGNGFFYFRSTGDVDNFKIDNSGNTTIKNSLYINNPFGRTTHLPYLGNNENYIRGKVNIDQDALYVGGGVIFNSTLSVANFTTLNGGLSHKTYIQPIIVSYTYYGAGNPWTISSYNKNETNTNPRCIYYVTAGAYFGIYMCFNISSGLSFSPVLYYNGGITNYIPYFTGDVVNGTIMWIYNAQAGIQVSVVEYWFN